MLLAIGTCAARLGFAFSINSVRSPITIIVEAMSGDQARAGAKRFETLRGLWLGAPESAAQNLNDSKFGECEAIALASLIG